MLTTLGLIAISFVTTPYIWGGSNSIEGLDCSGFVQKVLEEVGIDPPGDQTAQGLYNHFVKIGKQCIVGPDSLLFFGKSPNKITHIAIALTKEVMIEAGGGDSRTKTREDAIKKEARVRIVPIAKRKDLLDAFRITY